MTDSDRAAAHRIQEVFAKLGYPLSTLTAVSPDVIATAELRLGVKIPTSLRTYYAVAGNEKRLNHAHNRLLLPHEWFLMEHRLAFMEENQAVVYWGVDPDHDRDDGPVYQASNVCPVIWRKEHDSVLTFLEVMLHWQATAGGAMPYTSSAAVGGQLKRKLKSCFSYAGEVNGMHAFNAEGIAVCYLRWASEESPKDWRIFAGATTAQGLKETQERLGVEWEGA